MAAFDNYAGPDIPKLIFIISNGPKATYHGGMFIFN